MYSIIIPAGGNSSRCSQDKLRFSLSKNLKAAKISLLEITVNTFVEDKRCSQIIVPLNRENLDYFSSLKNSVLINKKVKLILGGKTRQESVYVSLKHLNEEHIVLVHDGARPLIRKKLIDSVLDSMSKKEIGVVPVLRLTDTIKEVNKNRIIKTYNRDSLVLVQTPQAFKKDILISAHEHGVKNNFHVNDDSELIEKDNKQKKVLIITGDASNEKITTDADLNSFWDKLTKWVVK